MHDNILCTFNYVCVALCWLVLKILLTNHWTTYSVTTTHKRNGNVIQMWSYETVNINVRKCKTMINESYIIYMQTGTCHNQYFQSDKWWKVVINTYCVKRNALINVFNCINCIMFILINICHSDQWQHVQSIFMNINLLHTFSTWLHIPQSWVILTYK